MGQHLFSYYLWKFFPLTGSNSLLERFYSATDAINWAKLFAHVGYILSNSKESIDQELIDRVIDFFEWRFNAADPKELLEFTSWLRAECLAPEWRLQSYSKILDFKQGSDNVFLDVRYLKKQLTGHLPLAVECFAKITDMLDQTSQMYILASDAKPILKAGLNSEDQQVRKNAERARENLVRQGRSSFLDI